jgi:hypothetical protein
LLATARLIYSLLLVDAMDRVSYHRDRAETV